jgi:nucleoside-diphosphate-sugar epimerase
VTRIVLTGATGFLGRHIVGAAPPDVSITRLTRSTSACEPNELALGQGAWNRASFARALEIAKPDVVVHCAGSTNSRDSRECFDSNTLLAAELLHAVMSLAAPPRVLLIGSAAEYGFVSEADQPVEETHSCAPLTDYGVAKYAQTMLALSASLRGLEVLVVRPFNLIGAGMPSHLALASFAGQILSAPSPAMIQVGNLSVARDFVDVEDAARIILALAALPKWPWTIVNLCSERTWQIGDLLERLIGLSGRPVHIEANPTRIRQGEMLTLTGCAERLASVGIMPPAPDFDALLRRLLTFERTRLA